MSDRTPEYLTKDVARGVLHRAGYEAATIAEALAQLPDPIELNRDATALERYGITRDRLIDALGGSP